MARERVLILDGGMGTSLHRYHPSDRDWGYGPDGKSLLNGYPDLIGSVLG